METQKEYLTYVSPKSVAETVEGLKKAIDASGLKVFCQIDHAKEAYLANLSLAEEQLIIFGDPKVGTFLMQENPLIGIELPLKILIWSSQGKTNIAFPNVLLWQKRFDLSTQVPILEKMLKLLDRLALQDGSNTKQPQ